MRGGGFGVEGVRDVLEIVAIAIVDQESGSIEQFRIRIQLLTVMLDGARGCGLE